MLFFVNKITYGIKRNVYGLLIQCSSDLTLEVMNLTNQFIK